MSVREKKILKNNIVVKKANKVFFNFIVLFHMKLQKYIFKTKQICMERVHTY